MIVAYLDLFWALSALIYDAGKLSTISWYLWPVVVICPLYPLLLAIVFFKITKNRPVNQFLLAFAALPSAVFGILALTFYPMLMVNEDFNWLGLGQILWVAFYSAQGWYLLVRQKFSLLLLVTVDIYLIGKFFLDYRYLSFGYLDLDRLSQIQLLALFVAGLGALMVVNVVVVRKIIGR